MIIVGAAQCVVNDMYEAIKLIESENGYSEFDYIAIGFDAINKCRWPIQYFATYHPSEIAMTKERRAGMGGNTDYKVISHIQYQDMVDMIIPFEAPSGSSALLGVLAAIKMGYQKIIVCGCPLIGCNDKGYDYANFRKGWEAKLNEIQAFTRSMTGWTREILGAPTREWIKE